jgi:hypothetical protein
VIGHVVERASLRETEKNGRKRRVIDLTLEDLEYGFLSYIIYNNQFVIYVIVAIGHYDEISNFLLFQTT